MNHYCTYFDKNYLYKGLTLYRSLLLWAKPFVLHALCFDEVTYEILSRMKLQSIELISRDEFLDGDPQLQSLVGSRSRVEFYWTCTPSLPLYLFRRHPRLGLVTYLDADLFFFSSPSPVFEEFGESSVLIVEHRYPDALRYLEVNGIYNVQMLSFRRDDNSMICLEWWRDKCLEWCYNRLENGRMGDQKYLDDWPRRFRGVHVLGNIGAGVAPWNVREYSIQNRDGRVYVDEVPLIFYHFHQFRVLTAGRFYRASGLYTKGRELPEEIYQPYIQAITESISDVHAVAPSFDGGIDSHIPVMLQALMRRYLPTTLKNAAKGILFAGRRLSP